MLFYIYKSTMQNITEQAMQDKSHGENSVNFELHLK